MSLNNTKTNVSFADDIIPIFYRFKNQMMWRLDLTKYEDVKTNYPQILERIVSKTMPPPPYDPLPQADIDVFIAWERDGFLE